MITMYGMSDKFGVMGLATIQNQYLDGQMGLTCAQDTAAEVDDEIHAVLMHCFGEAVQILEDNRTLLDEIAGYLLIKETITGAEMMSFIHNEPIAAEPAPAAQSDDAAAEDPSAVPAGEMRSSADAAPGRGVAGAVRRQHTADNAGPLLRGVFFPAERRSSIRVPPANIPAARCKQK